MKKAIEKTEKIKNKRSTRIKKGFLVTLGFILSPLSWWNDILVNLPLAYIFAIPFGFISKSLFVPMMMLGYWITNVVGFILMHRGFTNVTSKENKKYTKKELIKDLMISIIYTLIVVVFILKGWIRFPTEYFK
ncbi:MAG: hypothetical protein V1888_01945 [archaeon]